MKTLTLGKVSLTKSIGATRKNLSWGHSSAGRAPAWHAGGQRFEPAWLHNKLN